MKDLPAVQSVFGIVVGVALAITSLVTAEGRLPKSKHDEAKRVPCVMKNATPAPEQNDTVADVVAPSSIQSGHRSVIAHVSRQVSRPQTIRLDQAGQRISSAHKMRPTSLAYIKSRLAA